MAGRFWYRLLCDGSAIHLDEEASSRAEFDVKELLI